MAKATAERIAKLKGLLLASAGDVAIDLCDYDRKNDDELKPRDVDMLIEGGHVTITEILNTIRDGLRELYPTARE
jgi:hypothetical protein